MFYSLFSQTKHRVKVKLNLKLEVIISSIIIFLVVLNIKSQQDFDISKYFQISWTFDTALMCNLRKEEY